MSDFFVLFKGGGVYFFGASIFHVCLLSGGENEYIFFCIRFIFVLFSLRKFEIFTVWLEFLLA